MSSQHSAWPLGGKGWFDSDVQFIMCFLLPLVLVVLSAPRVTRIYSSVLSVIVPALTYILVCDPCRVNFHIWWEVGRV